MERNLHLDNFKNSITIGSRETTTGNLDRKYKQFFQESFGGKESKEMN